MTSEKLPPEAGGMPGPAVCLTGSFLEVGLILPGLTREEANEAICSLVQHTYLLQRLFRASPIPAALLVGKGGSSPSWESLWV